MRSIVAWTLIGVFGYLIVLSSIWPLFLVFEEFGDGHPLTAVVWMIAAATPIMIIAVMRRAFVVLWPDWRDYSLIGSMCAAAGASVVIGSFALSALWSS